MLRVFAAVALAFVAGCTRELPSREVVGFLASPFAMTTRVQWTLYQVDGRTATQLVSTEVARSIDARGDIDQQRIACLLHTRSRAGKPSYRLEPVGAYRFSESGWSAPQDWPPDVTRTLISFCDPIADLPPQDERIVFVEGAPAPPDARVMTVERFAAQTANRCTVVTVRWWDVVSHPTAAPNPPMQRTATASSGAVE